MDEAEIEARANMIRFDDGRITPEQARLMARAELGLGESEPAFVPRVAPSGGLRVTTLLLFALALITGLFGIAYYPMALMITAMLNSSKPAFNYAFGISSALRILPQYAICASAFFAAFVVIAIVELALRVATALVLGALLGTIIQSVVVSTVGLYQLLASAHLVGRPYDHTERRIGWF